MFLSKAPDFEPVLTTAVAAMLLSIGVAALVIYRDYALAFVTPSHTANSLGRRIREAMWRASQESTSQGVADYLRRRSVSWVEDLRELSRTLRQRGDDDGSSEVSSTLGGALGAYALVKTAISERSNWFPIRTTPSGEQEGWSYFDRRRMMRSLGMGRPVKYQRDSNWFEDTLLRALAETRHDALSKDLTITLRKQVSALAMVATAAAKSEQEYCASKVEEELRALARASTGDNLERWSGELINIHLEIARAHLEEIRTLDVPITSHGWSIYVTSN